MTGRAYSQHLGLISDEQFQAALDRFYLGHLIRAEPIPFGLFGQNVFIRSTQGEYVLRGRPHFWWQFPTEQFYARFLHECAHAPAPWPYLIDPSPAIFGWSYVLKPRMPGLQLADPKVREQLSPLDRLAIARTLGKKLAYIQEAKWPASGRYQAATDTVEAFEPCIVLEDYKRENLVILQQDDGWQVSGIFDLMGSHFGDGEADLPRQYALYLDEDPHQAQAFFQGYLNHMSPRPGFTRRFPVYMLLDRAIIWEFVHRHEPLWWDGKQTFRDWASPDLFLEES